MDKFNEMMSDPGASRFPERSEHQGEWRHIIWVIIIMVFVALLMKAR